MLSNPLSKLQTTVVYSRVIFDIYILFWRRFLWLPFSSTQSAVRQLALNVLFKNSNDESNKKKRGVTISFHSQRFAVLAAAKGAS